MDQFKLKSIDELDIDFVSGESDKNNEDEKGDLSALLTPEAKKFIPVQQKPVYSGENYFSNQEATVNNAQNKARPLVPLSSDFSYAPDNEQNNEDFPGFSGNEPYEADESSQKSSGGMLALKIISVIMICATVVTFLFGCFICVFLDNNGLSVGGITFNTCSNDIDLINVSKGDLIIAKKPSDNVYSLQDIIAVPSPDLKGADIQTVVNISPVSVEDNQITTNSYSGIQNSYLGSQCYGVVTFYIPSLGGIFSFALENAILVSILFVLLVAFWSLVLILSGKTRKTSRKNED